MAKVISICQNKGGVGKTTTTINLGYLFSQEGKVLLIDLDAQANLSQSFNIYLSESDLSLKDFIDSPSPSIIRNVSNNLDVLPNSPTFERWKKNIYSKKNISYLLREALSSVKNDYDYILIDCPPSLDISFDLALYTSDYALIIMDGQPYSLENLDNIIYEINQANKDDITKTLDIKILGLVFARYENLIITNDIIEVAKQKYDVFNTLIRKNKHILESQALKQSVIEYNSESKATKDYQDLFKEIVVKING